jgi:hypothetical protein
MLDLQVLQVATKKHPLPTLDEWGNMACITGGLDVRTERSGPDFRGRFWRECPCPSLLPHFWELLTSQDKSRSVYGIFSERGTGKTSMLETVIGLLYKDGGIKIDCSGMNLRELIWKTVISDGNQGLLTMLNNRLHKGEMNPANIALIQNAAKSYLHGSEDLNGGSRQEIDFQEIKERASIEELTQIAAVLGQVAHLEGLTKEKNAVGLSYEPGIFLEAHDRDIPLILDEFPRALPGSPDSFNEIFRVLAGQTQGKSLELREKGMTAEILSPAPKRRFRVFVAGNRRADGHQAITLDSALLDRLDPILVGSPTAADIAHYVCMSLTGLPLTTIQATYNNTMPPFEFLMAMRTAGLNDEERELIPSNQIELLDRPKDVAQAALQIGDYHVAARQLMRQDDVSVEINGPDEANYILFGVRTACEHVRKALEKTALNIEKLSTSQEWDWDVSHFADETRIHTTPNKSDSLEMLGTTLSEITTHHAHQVSHGSEKAIFRAKLIDLLELKGFQTPSGTSPNINSPNIGRPLSTLLDRNQQEIQITQQALDTQEILCRRLQSLHPELKKTPAEKIISSLEIQSCFNALRRMRVRNRNHFVVIPNRDYLKDTRNQTDEEKFAPPIRMVEMFDVTDGEEYKELLNSDQLVDAEDVFLTLCAPSTLQTLKGTNTKDREKAGMRNTQITAHQIACKHNGKAIQMQVIIKNSTNEVHIVSPIKMPSYLDGVSNVTLHHMPNNTLVADAPPGPNGQNAYHLIDEIVTKLADENAAWEVGIILLARDDAPRLFLETPESKQTLKDQILKMRTTKTR